MDQRFLVKLKEIFDLDSTTLVQVYTGYCTSFKMYIIQKLKGSGGLDTFQDNSKLNQIDSNITKQMKIVEENYIRKMYTQYPYGCNDRIGSLENKDSITVNLPKIF